MFRSTTCALVGILALTGCRLHSSSAWIVDGVRLEESHRETLSIGDWDPAGLELMVNSGDVRFETSSDSTTITLELHEVTQGDAKASYADGRIVLETRSGEPAAIGDVVIRTSTEIPRLNISAGMGDLDGHGVHVTGDASLSTGMGDLDLDGVTIDGRVTLSTGMGDLAASDCVFGRLVASSGMGDLDLRAVTAKDTAISSGMGDVEVADSAFGLLEIDTGMGDVELNNSNWTDSSFDTGLGSVRKD